MRWHLRRSSRDDDDGVASAARPAARAFGTLLLLALAALPRVAWYSVHQPDLPPDAYSYLNVAREWRGERAPAGGWDDRAQLPWDNQAARTPGYPLFLNLVFVLARHSPTPEPALAVPRRILVPGTAVRAHHFEHLQTDENVRAVQAAQHALGVAATMIAFRTMELWTGSAFASGLGALAAIGWNPVWVMTYEPSVMGETLSGVLLVVAIWLVRRRPPSAIRDHLAAIACGVDVLVRPAMIFSAPAVLAYLVWVRRDRRWRALAVLSAPCVLVALLVVNNGVRYGYWGISSVGGVTLMSHAAQHPEGLDEPFRRSAEAIRGNQFGGQLLLYTRYIEDGRPFRDAARDVRHAATAYILEHPRWYLASVLDALIDFFSPPLRLVAGEYNRVRERAPAVWLALSVCAELLMLAGFAALFLPVPHVVKLGPVIFLVSALGTSLAAHTENRRFAAAIVPLVVLSGATTLYAGARGVDERAAPPRRAGDATRR